jgi:NAD(P)-dependent dehydrogenase (short-subunit alcohol dehydrogenase family)
MELLSLSGTVAVVTGAGRGIGAQIARRLAQGGAAVVAVDLNLEAATQVGQDIQRAGGQAQVLAADVSCVADANRAVAEAVSTFGRLDILVNNAAVFQPSSALELTEEIWDMTCDVNLKGLFFWSRAAARQMIADKVKGRIVNLTSVNSILPNPNLPHYAATKGGVVSATRALAQEFGRYGIRVNSVAPGSTNTPGAQAISADVLRDLNLRRGEMPPPRSVLGRHAEPDDIACAVYFLCCGLSDYITGSDLAVDGGFFLV